MHFKISTRLAMGFGLLLTLLTAFALLAIWNMQTLAGLTEKLYRHPMAVSNAILAADGNIVRMHRGIRDVALAADEAELRQAEEAIAGFEKQVATDMDIVRERFLGPKSMVEDIQRPLGEWKPIRERIIALKREGRNQEAVQLIKSEGTRKTTEVFKAVQALKEWALNKGASFHAEAQASRDRMVLIFLTVGGLSVVFAAVVGYRVSKSVTRPLESALAAATAIAAGDLTGSIETAGRDEVGLLLGAMAAMQERLRHVALQIRSSAGELASAAQQLSVNSEQVARSSDEQSSAASAMSSAVEQMTVSIGQVGENARNAETVSAESGQLSDEGTRVILQAVEGMGRIAGSVQESSVTITDLEQKSSEIFGIAGVIREIADQTNLLALNAAIEAARAGEAGRGFAVVADEVRGLAERTRQSTEEISRMLATIQQGTRVAVQNMDKGVALVSDGTALAREAGDAIQRINTGTQRVATEVSDISNAIREQKSASEQIARNVENIARMAEHNNAAAKETATSAQGLQWLARSLEQEAAWFRT